MLPETYKREWSRSMYTADLSQGTEIVPPDGRKGSLCFDCIHSGASVIYQCSWDRSLVLPRGAKFFIKPDCKRPVVVECPLFEKGHIYLNELRRK